MTGRRAKKSSTIQLVALLAILAVPAVSLALPQDAKDAPAARDGQAPAQGTNDRSRPPGMRGGGGGTTAQEPARPAGPAAPATRPAAPPAAAPQGPAPALAPPRAAEPARPAAEPPVAAVPDADAVEKLLEEGATTSAALHGAIAVRDWERAQREAVLLRDQLARMAEPDLRSLALRERAMRLQRVLPMIDTAIARRDVLRANDAAYRIVYGLVDAITVVSASRGGGGGTPAAAAAVPVPVDHLRRGYPEVMKAHAALLRGDAAEAKAHLDAVREHLQAGLKAGPGPAFARRLDDLNKRRWRVVAALAEPQRAQRLSVALTRAYAEAVHAVGQYATLGGGGGTVSRGATARLRAVLRPLRERSRGSDALPYDKRR